MTISLRDLCAFAAGALFTGLTAAQTLPPACEKYFRALDACNQNALNVSPSNAPQIRSTQQDVDKLREMLRAGLKTKGYDGIAAACAESQLTPLLKQQVVTIVTSLAMTNSVDANCRKAYNALGLR
ncbi:hypothetical protein PI87_27765 [Ralstonia sp. A12]|uniref:hypothetical protein n=1 Tax=Ralstonia sp. A12 TaxID=1217052 RepID=UPI00057425C9|nr:hypothetical protein [Ralstonia sp. A12]KHK48634.1 hypothetical protein PI87_27765 [Ralstonia sp. A12]